jgi:hypothetical protein
VKFSHRSTNLVLLSIAALAVAVPLFWIEGGCYWLQTRVIPPRRPRFMPLNSIWIEFPSLPVSWHRGAWFGCGLSHSGTANYCRLVGTDGELVYGGEYLSCATHSPIAEKDIHLVPPRSTGEAWLFTERSKGVVGLLADGEIMLPVTDIEHCAEIKGRLFPESQ